MLFNHSHEITLLFYAVTLFPLYGYRVKTYHKTEHCCAETLSELKNYIVCDQLPIIYHDIHYMIEFYFTGRRRLTSSGLNLRNEEERKIFKLYSLSH
jgi:hypothetical protein